MYEKFWKGTGKEEDYRESYNPYIGNRESGSLSIKYVSISEFKRERGLFYADKSREEQRMGASEGRDVFVVPEYQGIIRVNGNLEHIGETAPKKLQMKNCVILKSSWLRYAPDISEKAFEITPNICAYTQLAHFLLNPASGRPTKFICKVKTSPDAIFQCLLKDYPDLKMEDGLTSEMIGNLGREKKRSVYSYDFHEKCFFKLVTSDKSNNYCPITFYRGNGHMYLIDSKDATKSIVERNKSENIQVSSRQQEKKKDELEVIQSVDFNGIYLDGVECIELQKGYYLLNRYSICYDVIQFIKNYKERMVQLFQ